MSSPGARGIHWFRNDLRLRDNTTLASLADEVENWIPIFVIDPELAPEKSDLPRVRFLLDCVRRLRDDLAKRGVTLWVFEGDPTEIIPELVRVLKIDFLSFGESDTPFGQRRDRSVQDAVCEIGAKVLSGRDHTVFSPHEIRTKTGGAYSIYTPYRNTWWKAFHQAPRLPARQIRIPDRPITRVPASLKKRRSGRLEQVVSTERSLPSGGEAAGLRRLKAFLAGPAATYAHDRDRPDVEGTSRLSPYLRFGVVSIRACFDAGLTRAKEEPHAREGILKWLDELVWREFYATVLSNSPQVLTQSFRPVYDGINWSSDEEAFQAWCEGRTGYPFIDAGMRQLRSTGWMHNRVRMVVASFLTKDLLIDWRRGAAYFFDALVDGDPASNNGGWQWAASTGTDAQPYFRIFNPTAQGQRWDPEGRYIRQYVPELRDVPTKMIHEPWKMDQPPGDYPAPIVDHAASRDRALAEYRRVRSS